MKETNRFTVVNRSVSRYSCYKKIVSGDLTLFQVIWGLGYFLAIFILEDDRFLRQNRLITVTSSWTSDLLRLR